MPPKSRHGDVLQIRKRKDRYAIPLLTCVTLEGNAHPPPLLWMSADNERRRCLWSRYFSIWFSCFWSPYGLWVTSFLERMHSRKEWNSSAVKAAPIAS